MEVERISTDKHENEHYLHEFKFKGVLKHAQTIEKLDIISSVFAINCEYRATTNNKNFDDLTIRALTTDKTPNNAINRGAWILRQLDKLIGLKLED